MNNNILIIDDEEAIIELMDIYLTNEGYNVYKAYNGKSGLEILSQNDIDLVVLDIMMPGIDGLQVCKIIREDNNIPIIMLSSKSQDIDKILGLGIGADDYMVKPFNPMELIARIKSQVRRYLYLNKSNNQNHSNNIITVKGLVINKNNHKVTLYDELINLTPTEYKILLLLASNLGTVFSTEEIFEKIWEEKYFESNNTVMVHIWRLREKIEGNPKEPKLIETVWGVGYKIED
ncbi:response regulator transcription factor [Wukongibacter sp. M2B1]|uniref:response regulator transcription factor n=1 Tax=Wukongibacter sp. M2B1 TaxID=3088895 RepID=UPI003D7B7B23